MEQNQRPSSSRSYQFHPAKVAITDLFNLYLGVIPAFSFPFFFKLFSWYLNSEISLFISTFLGFYREVRVKNLKNNHRKFEFLLVVLAQSTPIG